MPRSTLVKTRRWPSICMRAPQSASTIDCGRHLQCITRPVWANWWRVCTRGANTNQRHHFSPRLHFRSWTPSLTGSREEPSLHKHNREYAEHLCRPCFVPGIRSSAGRIRRDATGVSSAAFFFSKYGTGYDELRPDICEGLAVFVSLLWPATIIVPNHG